MDSFEELTRVLEFVGVAAIVYFAVKAAGL
jgi:hypothetical protein